MSVNFKDYSHISHVEGKLKDDLKKYWRGEKDGFVQVGTKKWLYPAKYEKLAEKYKNFEVRPDDVWITGFPRSGTTVTQELVWLLCHNLDFEAAKEDLDERVRYYELEVVFNNKTTAERAKLFPEDEELPRLTECIESTLRLLEEDTKRRVIKTHFPFELSPDDIMRKGCKVVYVCRQPKDVAVSYYHYEKGSWHLDYTGDFKRYWNHFKNGEWEKDGYVQVGQKKWFLPVKYRKLAEEYKNFEVRSNDVWIMGYPRSGTTLTEEIVWLLCHNLDFEGVKKFRPRLFENSLVLNDKTVEEILQQCPDEEISFARKKETLKLLEQDKTRRVIKTHLPLELLPDDIIKKGCKIIYICRDPKDISVSYFLLQSSLRHIKFSGDFEKYLQFFRNGNCLFGPHFEHVKQAYSRIGSKNFMFVFFEEFKKDLRAFVTKLAQFLEISLSEEQLKQMEEHLSLDNFSKKMNTLKDVKNQTVNFVRKGKVGGWREHYTEEMIRETDAWIEANKEMIGIKYPVQ